MLQSLTAAIRNALARPSKAKALAIQQTDSEPTGERAQIGQLKRERAEHPSRGLTPSRLYQILESAEAGDLVEQHALFADMEEKNTQIGTDLGKRKQAASELEWSIVPPDNASSKEIAAADQAREIFDGLEVEDLIVDLGDGIGHGWVNLELSWVRDGNARVIEPPQWRDHTWFRLHPDQLDTLTLRDGSSTGETLWPLGWVQHRHKSKSGYLSRLGLHRTLVWLYLFGGYAVGDLAELLEILGIPARLGKYPAGASRDEKATLLRAVVELGHSAAGIIPEGMMIEYLEAAKADGATHQVMLDWCERSISKAILGGTLTTGTDGGGAYALGEVHERGLMSLVSSDSRQYAATIRRDILWPLAALNHGIIDPRRAPRWFLDLGETEDYQALANALPVFVDYGARIPVRWLHERTRIPQATGNEPVLGRTPTAQPQAEPTEPPDTTALAVLRNGVALPAPPGPTEQIVGQLQRSTAPVFTGWVDQLQAVVDGASSLADARGRIIAAFGTLPTDQLTGTIADATTAAHAAGRSDLEEESE